MGPMRVRNFGRRSYRCAGVGGHRPPLQPLYLLPRNTRHDVYSACSHRHSCPSENPATASHFFGYASRIPARATRFSGSEPQFLVARGLAVLRDARIHLVRPLFASVDAKFRGPQPDLQLRLGESCFTELKFWSANENFCLRNQISWSMSRWMMVDG